MSTNEIPRRICLDQMTPAELAIYVAMQAVERAGADVRLTHAVIKLAEARALVADFVDGVPEKSTGTVRGNGDAPTYSSNVPRLCARCGAEPLWCRECAEMYGGSERVETMRALAERIARERDILRRTAGKVDDPRWPPETVASEINALRLVAAAAEDFISIEGMASCPDERCGADIGQSPREGHEEHRPDCRFDRIISALIGWQASIETLAKAAPFATQATKERP